MEQFTISRNDLVFNETGELDVKKSKAPWIHIDSNNKISVDMVLLAKYIIRGKYSEDNEWIVEYKQILSDNGISEFFIYDEDSGVWRKVVGEQFKGYINKFIPGEIRKNTLKNELWSEITQSICTEKICKFDDFNSNIEQYINFQDGFLNIKTKELIPHTHKILSTIQIPCKYKDVIESNGESPVFDKYMNDLCEGKEDYKQLLLEYSGVVMSNISGAKFKKVLFMKGTGDTGKSQLRELMVYMIGPDNHQSIQLKDFTDKYMVSEIYGKRLSGHGELDDGVISNLSKLKAVTGGDTIYSDRKFMKPIQFVYKGLLWFNSNHYPKFGGDKGKWLYDRMILLEFNNVIPENKKDHEILDKMKKEKNGIAFKMLQALYKVLENGYRFDLPDDIDELRRRYMEENSIAIQFIERCCTKAPFGNMKTLRSMFYNKYVEYCRQSENVPKGKQKVFTEIEETLGTRERTFFCNIHGTWYLRDYVFDPKKFDEEMGNDENRNGQINIPLDDKDLEEIEGKIIDINSQKLKDGNDQLMPEFKEKIENGGHLEHEDFTNQYSLDDVVNNLGDAEVNIND